MESKGETKMPPGTGDDVSGKRFIRVDAVYSRKDRQIHLVKTAKAPHLPSKLRKYAFIVKRVISSKGMVASTGIQVFSSSLCRVLQDVFPAAEALGLDQETPEVSRETLWYARPALIKRLEQECAKEISTPEEVIISDIKATLDFLDEEFQTVTSEMTALRAKDLVSYSLIWCLFPPLVEIYTDTNALHEPQVLRCKYSTFKEDQQTGERWFEIVGECLNHDGENFGWSEQTLKIPRFEGTSHITSLSAYPLSHHPEQKLIRDRLDVRGGRFVELLMQPTCKGYDGMALHARRMGKVWEEDVFGISGRVMVDPDRFFKACSSSNPLLGPPCPRPKSFAPINTPSKDLMFCHYRVLGFSFAQKRWCALAVSQLHDPHWNDKAFDEVMMPSVRRELMRDLVSAHGKRDEASERFDDIIKGKGRGLIGLLSGAPGVGKTLTAEALAEVSHRPLYTVSAGQLGTEVSGVDEQLGVVLDLASLWNCVLLIDECDVFLRQRDHSSLINNALVSIFLTQLEYFQGLAILTTSRVDDIDAAFLSRLHFRFHYEALEVHQRVELWQSFLGDRDYVDDYDLKIVSRDYALSGQEASHLLNNMKTHMELLANFDRD